MRNSLLQIKSFLFITSFLAIATIANAQDRPFITVWQTDNPGTSEDNQITIPGTGTNYSIEWEEVGNEANSNGSETGTDEHTVTFPSAGTYRVKISGDFSRIEFRNQGDKEKILDIAQWGDIQWTSFENAFYGCVNFDISTEDAPSMANVTNMSYIFRDALNFNGSIGHWNVSKVTDMTGTFLRARSFNQNLDNWDVSSVLDMSFMFSEATLFNQDLGNWDVSNVTDMSSMFSEASAFNQSLNNWDVSKVTDMGFMFSGATSFNQDLGDWDVSEVRDMGSMFQRCYSFNGDISDWDVSNVTNMYFMLANAISFNQDVSGWNVAKVTNMGSMFLNDSSFNQNIGSWDVSSVKNMTAMLLNTHIFNQDIGDWDVSRVENMRAILENAHSFNQNLGSWDISSVNDMSYMLDFSGLDSDNYDQTIKGWAAQGSVPTEINLGAKGLTYCSASSERSQLIQDYGWTINGDSPDCGPAFTTVWKTDNEGGSNDNQITLPLTGTEYNIYWEEIGNTQNSGGEVGNNTHSITFPQAGTYRVKIEGDISNVNFSFSDDNLKLLELENWGYTQWTNFNAAFAGAENLTITANDAPDLSQVTDMSRMFYNAKSLNQDISHWDVSNVTNMSDLFHGASAFNQDLSNWDVSNVTKMSRMFASATAFNQDLTDWNTVNVTDISGMFYEATSLDQDLGDWDLSSVGSLFEFLTNSGLSVQNYDATLEGWATNANIPSDIALSAEGLAYCASEDYRQQLIDDFGWGITGDVQCSLALEETFPAAEATHVEKDTEIYLTFDQTFEEIDFSNIQLSDVSGNSVTINNVVADSLTLRIIHSGLGFNTYEVTVPEITLVSTSGKVNNEIKWSFATQSILAAKDKQLATNLTNYPNPFSDYTTLSFSLTESNSFDLLVYNVKGQLVRQESYSNRASGEQSIKFERKELPTGLYHYQIQATQGAVSGKMMIK